MRKQVCLIGLLMTWAAALDARAVEMGTHFTYQGRLIKNGAVIGDPAPVICDMTFGLWDAASFGNQIGMSPIGPLTISVDQGLFNVNLSFGADAFNGQARWLEITVQCPGDSGATILAPRQQLRPAPGALSLPGMYTVQGSFSPSVIGGKHENTITAGVSGATIGGGGASAPDNNRVTDTFGTVSGGCSNRAGDDAGTVNDSQFATVGGGFINHAAATYSTVSGGYSNDATSLAATVSGGFNNLASGFYSSTVGGLANEATGDYSLAAGRRAKAMHAGSAVWADSTDADFASSGNNQFSVRASGGTRIYSDAAASIGVQLAMGGNSWGMLSDKNAKENFKPIDPREVLRRVAELPVTMWNLKSQISDIKHLGPMAQDFHAAFGLGESDTHINSSDIDGVALAAIQGLNQIVQQKESEISDLRIHATERDCEIEELKSHVTKKDRELDDLKSEISDLKALVNALIVKAEGGAK